MRGETIDWARWPMLALFSFSLPTTGRGDERHLALLPAPLLFTLFALLAFALVSPAFAEKGKLRERLTPDAMAVVYPGGADRIGPEEGSPPAIAVYKGDKAVAYVFSTLD